MTVVRRRVRLFASRMQFTFHEYEIFPCFLNVQSSGNYSAIEFWPKLGLNSVSDNRVEGWKLQMAGENFKSS